MRSDPTHSSTAYDTRDILMFTHRAVQDSVPAAASGVYVVFTSRHWVYVGESEDIRQSLFRHLNEPSACFDRFGPLSFSFELATQAERLARQQSLIVELEPKCNAQGR